MISSPSFIIYQQKSSGTAGGSGQNYDLYPNYSARWKEFLDINQNVLTPEYVAAIYPCDEPTWIGIFFEELNPIVNLLKADLPSIPVALVEAYAAIASLKVPVGVDWLGMDRYGSPDVTKDADWLADYQVIKNKRTAQQQKMLLVMDAQWLPLYGEAGYPQSAMAEVNRRYYDLAVSDPDVLGIIGYVWTGGLDSPEHRDIRDLPPNVIDENKRIGKAITGK
ncbi:MAG: hypothetical protein AB7G93_20960 [Bdellovibrionales bacterium]